MDAKEMLVKNILPFWLKNGIDEENGGIFTCVDRLGRIYGTEKSVWFQGRALWIFSKTYNLIEKNPAYIKAAETIYNFLGPCTDTDGRMFFKVTRDGRPIQKRRYFFSETFGAIGCVEFYKATGREDVLEKAHRYFDTAYECFKGIRKTEPKFNPENQSLKALSPVMIMLSTAQVLRSVNKERYSDIVAECLDEILYGGYFAEKALMENIGQNGAFVDTPTGRIVNPGHSLEAAWFMMSEGLLSDNHQAVDTAKEIIDKTFPLGWDKTHGGIIAFADVHHQPPVQLEWDMKLWWPQCEAMIATRLAYIVYKDVRYRQMYEALKAYCEKYFYDSQYGEWYGYLHYDNSLSTNLKGNIFKGPFHVPRMYMIMTVLDETGDIRNFF